MRMNFCGKLHTVTDLKPVFDAKRLNETFYKKPLLNQCSRCGEYVILNYGSEDLNRIRKKYSDPTYFIIVSKKFLQERSIF
jgi:hypothetical protein